MMSGYELRQNQSAEIMLAIIISASRQGTGN
jgi:hypothetical protein